MPIPVPTPLRFVQVQIDARDRKQWTPLHIAVFHKHKDIVAMLMDAGADPHLRTAFGQNACVVVALVLALDIVFALQLDFHLRLLLALALAFAFVLESAFVYLRLHWLFA